MREEQIQERSRKTPCEECGAGVREHCKTASGTVRNQVHESRKFKPTGYGIKRPSLKG